MTLPPMKIGLMALLGVAAAIMGYTTVFPNTESTYASQQAEQEVNVESREVLELASTSSPEAAATESMAQTADSVGQA
uniref:hypothetical protein n=1 Tax=uncultured Vibrio sp. TaxID=114054 RepID=UPI00261FBF63